jgi:hypothetical protein
MITEFNAVVAFFRPFDFIFVSLTCFLHWLKHFYVLFSAVSIGVFWHLVVNMTEVLAHLSKKCFGDPTSSSFNHHNNMMACNKVDTHTIKRIDCPYRQKYIHNIKNPFSLTFALNHTSVSAQLGWKFFV